MNKRKSFFWMGGLSVLWGLEMEAHPPEIKKIEDPAHRAALEARLQALEEKKNQLEAIPGSLDQQRNYQARIDQLAHRLGHSLTPFSISDEEVSKIPSVGATALGPVSETSMTFHESGREVDFFHDRSKVVAVNESIQSHGGGIHPQSSLLEELPRTNLHRTVSHPPAKGILIDGDQKPSSPEMVPAMASLTPGESSPMTEPFSYPLTFEGMIPPLQAAQGLPSFPAGETVLHPIHSVRGIADSNPAEPQKRDIDFASGNASKKDTQRGGLSAQPASSFPSLTGKMPDPLWGQTSTQKDYANKAGWSAAPPPIMSPLFYGTSPAIGNLPSSMPVVDHGEKTTDPRFSFSPKKLMHSWR